MWQGAVMDLIRRTWPTWVPVAGALVLVISWGRTGPAVLMLIAAVALALYLGVSVSLKGSTACISLSSHRACVTGSTR